MDDHSLYQKNACSVICRNCGKEYEAAAYSFIRADLDPNLKEQVIDGSLFSAECPYCGSKMMLNYETVYLDEESGIMIACMPARDRFELSSVYFELHGQNPALLSRITENINDLREKVMIFEAGLDDRTVELAKAVLRSTLKEKGYGSEALYFIKMFNHSLLFCTPYEGRNTFRMSISLDEAERIAVHAGLDEIDDEGEYVIDRRWAQTVLESMDEDAQKPSGPVS